MKRDGEPPMVFVRRRHDGRVIALPPEAIDPEIYEPRPAPKPARKRMASKRRSKAKTNTAGQ